MGRISGEEFLRISSSADPAVSVDLGVLQLILWAAEVSLRGLFLRALVPPGPPAIGDLQFADTVVLVRPVLKTGAI